MALCLKKSSEHEKTQVFAAREGRLFKTGDCGECRLMDCGERRIIRDARGQEGCSLTNL
jgi:hypothetical protein